MSANRSLTNEKEEDKTKQDDVLMDIPKKRERRNAVVLQPEDLANIFPEKNRTQKEPNSV